jgi:hypothetical protein
MIKQFQVFFGLILFTMCSAEKDWEYSASFPIILMDSVDVSASSARFHARIENKRDFENVTSYGFCWRGLGIYVADARNPEIGKDPTQGLQGSFPRDTFSIEVYSDITFGNNEVRAFAVVNGTTIYSNTIRFKGRGTQQPVIKVVSPGQAFVGEEISIRGKYFSRVNSMNLVQFDNPRDRLYPFNCTVTFSSDTLVEFILRGDPGAGHLTIKSGELNSDPFPFTIR